MRGKGLFFFFFLFCQLLGLNFLELELDHETNGGACIWLLNRPGFLGTSLSGGLCLYALQWVLPSECIFLKIFPIIFHLSSFLFFLSFPSFLPSFLHYFFPSLLWSRGCLRESWFARYCCFLLRIAGRQCEIFLLDL